MTTANKLLDIQLEGDHAAFADGNAHRETARILREIADEIETGNNTGLYQTVRDVNGNRCGAWRFTRIISFDD